MRLARLPAALSLAASLLSLAILVGCGSAGGQAPEHPFGDPPAPAPGVRAWAAGETGVLLVTADGGASWKRQRFFLPQRGVDVAFTDAQTGWLVTDAGTVLATTDGGAGWTVVEKVKLDVKALAAVDARTAWLAGNAVGAAGEPGASSVFRTTDGGDTWKRTSFGDALLADVAFADRRHGVLVALDRIWSTRDGGRSWRLRKQLPMTVLTSVVAGDSRYAWVAGWGTQDGAPLVCATRDGGATWRRLRVDVAAPEPGDLQTKQIVCAGESRLWLTCNAGVLATADGGETWALQKVAAGQPQAIAAADEQHVLATTQGQAILATADGGATWPAFGRDGFLAQPLVSIAARVKAGAGKEGSARLPARVAIGLPGWRRHLQQTRFAPQGARRRRAALQRRHLLGQQLRLHQGRRRAHHRARRRQHRRRHDALPRAPVRGRHRHLRRGTAAQLARFFSRRLGPRRSARRLLPDRPHPPDDRPAADLPGRQRLHHRDERRHGPLSLLVRRRRSPGRWQIVGAIVATIGLGALSLQGDFTLKLGRRSHSGRLAVLRAAHHDHRVVRAEGEADDPRGHPDGRLDAHPGRHHPVRRAHLARPAVAGVGGRGLDGHHRHHLRVLHPELGAALHDLDARGHLARLRERVRRHRRHRRRHGLRHVEAAGRRLADADRRVHRGAAAVVEGRRRRDRGGGGAGRRGRTIRPSGAP